MAPNQLGDFLKNRRAEIGLSLREVAEKAGLSPAQLSRIENGLSKKPGEGTLQNIAYALNSDVDDIFLLAGYVREESQGAVMETLREYYSGEAAYMQQSLFPMKIWETKEKYLSRNLDEALRNIVDVVAESLDKDEKEDLVREMRSAYDIYFKRRKIFKSRNRNSD